MGCIFMDKIMTNPNSHSSPAISLQFSIHATRLNRINAR